ncbi:MAG: type II toxin-antitoxin system VapC family toxin [Thermoleophilaceae bacterium]|nr:type II toxin-antitoxin system VapC family toxin [Thermoleophilaceae bacterium]
MLLDANLLVFAVHEESPSHSSARDWLQEVLRGARRVGFPWQSIGAFLRITTNPRIFARPLPPAVAWERVSDWLDSGIAWVPEPGRRHAEILGGLITRHHVSGNLVPDTQLAALAIEHGVTLCSADSDFARFAEVRWVNPLA